MSDAADRRIAELEAEVDRQRRRVSALDMAIDLRNRGLEELRENIEALRKQLVERDVYEAQQILPPEQAALIKHLATVERCIEEGPVIYSYAESSECAFCDEWQTGAHKKDCAWVLMQFDRKPEATMTMVHEHALNESMARQRRRDTEPPNTAADVRCAFMPALPVSLRRANEVVERSRAETLGNVRVYENPLVAPGRVYLLQNVREELNDPLDLEATSEHPVAPNLGIGGDESEVAPSDDDKVP